MPTIDHRKRTNCLADVETAGNGLRVRAFLRDVVRTRRPGRWTQRSRSKRTTSKAAPFAHSGCAPSRAHDYLRVLPRGALSKRHSASS